MTPAPSYATPNSGAWDLRSTSVVILGAGFSAAVTNGRMPLMSNFFDRLDRKREPLLYEFVETVDCNVKAAHFEAVMVAIEQIKNALPEVVAGWADKWQQNMPQLHVELQNYVLGRIKENLGIDQASWAIGMLSCCGPQTTVISLNYDNLAERILSARAHNLGLPHECHHCKMRSILRKSCNCVSREEITDADWRGALIKPHGSIAWKRCTNASCCNCDCFITDAHCRPFDPCCCPGCWNDCSPAIVLPTMGKDMNDMKEISVMWQAVRSAVGDAESLMIFGFSMARSDELFVVMMRSAICGNKRLKRIAIVDLKPDDVFERFKRCLPVENSITFTPFTVIPGKQPEWLRPVARVTAC